MHFTEVDVALPAGAAWSPEQEAKQAQVYAALLAVCLRAPACTSFASWGFTDAHTWLGAERHPL